MTRSAGAPSTSGFPAGVVTRTGLSGMGRASFRQRDGLRGRRGHGGRRLDPRAASDPGSGQEERRDARTGEQALDLRAAESRRGGGRGGFRGGEGRDQRVRRDARPEGPRRQRAFARRGGDEAGRPYRSGDVVASTPCGGKTAPIGIDHRPVFSARAPPLRASARAGRRLCAGALPRPGPAMSWLRNHGRAVSWRTPGKAPSRGCATAWALPNSGRLGRCSGRRCVISSRSRGRARGRSRSDCRGCRRGRPSAGHCCCRGWSPSAAWPGWPAPGCSRCRWARP